MFLVAAYDTDAPPTATFSHFATKVLAEADFVISPERPEASTDSEYLWMKVCIAESV